VSLELQTTFAPPSVGPGTPVKGLSNGGSGHCNGWTVHHLDESLPAEHTTGEELTDLSPRSPREENAQVSNFSYQKKLTTSCRQSSIKEWVNPNDMYRLDGEVVAW
jgi:hypothetical protein